ncbi:hypothetical protein AGMMS49944_28340 [Spirochaetia bacterium]|nr:hypothetical protein AGMMS49944_28340 [Spirochaetia bacterium]
MRNILLRSAAILFMAAALVITGCAPILNAVDPSIPSLGTPENVKADVTNNGGVILTWDLNVNAKGYEVWRKAPNGSFVKLTGNNTTGRYEDVISSTNELQDNTTYTYKIVAVSSKATSTSDDVVLNGTKDINVTTGAAQFSTAVTVNAPTGVTITLNETQGYARITWTPDTAPFVSYVLSGDNNGTTISGTAAGDAPFFDITITGSGAINVGVKAVFGDGTKYSASAVVYANDVYEVQTLPTITATLNVPTRVGNTDQVTITFTDVPDATAYVLERALVQSTTTARSGSRIDRR